MINSFCSRAILFAAGALAVTAVAEAEVAQGDDSERVVCKRQQTVGSRLGTRVCLTRAQWREREAAERNATREVLDRAERNNRDTFRYEDAPGGPGGG